MTQQNNEYTEVEPEVEYKFCVSGKTKPHYQFDQKISEWLQKNMEGLTDDNDELLFSQVNTGFNESSLKTFGHKPTCDVYVNKIQYDSTFDYSKPEIARSIIIFYFKGANNHSYMKACEIHDYLMQELIVNESFKQLESIVSDTHIIESRVMTQPIQKKWGVMGTFELAHNLY